MTFDLVYKATYLVTMLIVAWAGRSIWHRRSAPGGQALLWMMIDILWWNFCGFMKTTTASPAALIFWTKLGVFGSWTAQPLFLIYVLRFTQHERWVTRRNVLLLYIMPAVTMLMAVTNEWHSLLWSAFVPGSNGQLLAIPGIWFWISAAYINLAMVWGLMLLVSFTRRTRELHHRQNLWVIVASVFPWIGFAIYVSPFNPMPGLDLTAVSFAITGTLLVYLLTRLNFLDVVPVARDLLVDKMLDGLLVIDPLNRVIDINAAAQRIFHLDAGQKWLGLPAQTLIPPGNGLTHIFASLEKMESEWQPNDEAEPRAYELQVLPLLHSDRQPAGRAIIFRDITNRKNIENALWQANHELEEKLVQIERLKDELRELSIRDALTGLFNRRYIEEIFTRELLLARREGYPLSIIILDIDYFKVINDRYGHARGDEVLREMGKALQRHFRGGDITCRYGGDEFLLMMPNSQTQDAYHRIEMFRKDWETMISTQFSDLSEASFSAGIATYPAHAESSKELFRIADQTLYRAKTQGRNRTCLA